MSIFQSRFRVCPYRNFKALTYWFYPPDFKIRRIRLKPFWDAQIMRLPPESCG